MMNNLNNPFLEHQVLSYFQCPFETVLNTNIVNNNECNTINKNNSLTSSLTSITLDNLSSTLCTFHEHRSISNKVKQTECPFGHRKDGLLREIPPYICFNHLIGGPNQCQNQLIGGSWDNSNDMVRCVDGFHPTLEELVDLDHLHQKMAQSILLHDKKLLSTNRDVENGDSLFLSPAIEPTNSEISSFSTSENDNHYPQSHQCTVCLEHFQEPSTSHHSNSTNFAILQNCPHIFCADCIITWQKGPRPDGRSGPNRQCPMCRTISPRVMICQRLPRSPEEKRKLFDQQYKCFRLADRSVRKTPDQSDTDSTTDGEESDISDVSDRSNDSDDDLDTLNRLFSTDVFHVFGRIMNYDPVDDIDGRDELIEDSNDAITSVSNENDQQISDTNRDDQFSDGVSDRNIEYDNFW